MARLLSVLPEKQREILILRVVVGMSAEETAEAVGSTAGAVRVRAAPCAGAAQERNHGDGARPCLTSAAGPRTVVIRLSTRSTGPRNSSRRSSARAAGLCHRPRRGRAGCPAGRVARRRPPDLRCRASRRRARQWRRWTRPPRGDGCACRWRWWVLWPPRCCASAGSVRRCTDRARATHSYGVRGLVFGSAPVTRDVGVELASSELKQVQQLIDDGQWEQAQQKLQTLTTTVATVDDAAAQTGTRRPVAAAVGEGREPRPERDRAPRCAAGGVCLR